jgi:hypothetical protein
MNAAATLQPDADLSSAYMDLEPQIRDLAQMAELTRYYVSNHTFTSTEEEKRLTPKKFASRSRTSRTC